MQTVIEQDISRSSAAVDDAALWYALRTTARHEKRVHERLAGAGVEAFLPLCERLSRWKDRRKKVETPLFPGYCFARFARTHRLLVVRTFGVVGIVGMSGSPVPVDEGEIAALMKLVQSRLPYDPCPGLRPGMAVEVVRGPLLGVRGILMRRDTTYRLVIAINLIRQGAVVQIDAEDVRAL